MDERSAVTSVLGEYSVQFARPQIKALGSAGGFSGARFWKIASIASNTSIAGTACLRRWPSEHPSVEHLQFIHAVLNHVYQQGLHCVPVPYVTRKGASYVHCDGALWELTPWMPGQADFRRSATPERLQAAMATLARFHVAAANYPMKGASAGVSPGICDRQSRLNQWMAGGANDLARSIDPRQWPAMTSRAQEILQRFDAMADSVASALRRAARVQTPLQPCIRDVWHDHVLLRDAEVTGLIDFGAMQIDSVATDIARLLGSLVGDDTQQRQIGLDAYSAVRRLSASELELIETFDRSTVLLAGMNWLDWIYCQQRQFSEPLSVLSRVDEILRRTLKTELFK